MLYEVITLSILSLPVHSAQVLSVQWFILRTIDSAVLFLAISELLKGLKKSEYRRQFMLKNLPLTGFSALYLLVLAGLFIKDFTSGHEPYINLTVIVFRSLFLLYRGFENVKSIETALSVITSYSIHYTKLYEDKALTHVVLKDVKTGREYDHEAKGP